MADVISAVRTYVLAQSSVNTTISQRMYFDVLMQGATLPACVISVASERHDHLIQGRAGLVHTRINIECHSLNRLTTNALAKAIIECGIDLVQGVTNSVDIRGVQIEDGQRQYIDYDSAAGDDHTYVTEFDLMVHHKD